MDLVPALTRPDLLARPTLQVIEVIAAHQFLVAEIDPDVADTAAMCDRYGVALEHSANCVVIAGKRGDEMRMAACVILATTRADVNGVVRKRLDARKASFAPMDIAVAQTGMEYGGITPFGLPESWPVYVDSRVVKCELAIYGSGVRRSKLFSPGSALLDLPSVEVIDGLAN